jgi:hypothetical protein
MYMKGGTKIINLDPFFKILYFTILSFLIFILCFIAIFWDMNKIFSIQVFLIICLIFSVLLIIGLIIWYLGDNDSGSDEQYRN